MTEAEVLSRCIANDERNLLYVQHKCQNLNMVRQVAADCGIRFIEALDYGDQDLVDLAIGNLRNAARLAVELNAGYSALRRGI